MSKKYPYSRVYVEITNLCNRNCSFCPGTLREPKMMTADEFRTIAEKLTGVTGYLYYHLMGEPLTHPQLPEMLAIASELGFKSQITTNGTLLQQRGQALIDAKVHKVNLSVHSFEEGADEDYVNYINSCLDFADLASRAGTIVVLRLWNQGYDEGRNISTLDLTRAKFPWAWTEEPRATRIQDRLYLEHGDRFDWPDLGAEDGGSAVFCHGLRDHFGILSDGTVVPCCLDHNGDIPLGNVFGQSIEDILNAPRARAIVEGFSRRKAAEELCRKCGYARRFN
ncbi:MAG: SPASM domain-containing protein [Oscillospiraceae bacterium]|nr:SPASM domain-containing protein [Oscillospiraceae bacterium]